jgi:hypothetical protein
VVRFSRQNKSSPNISERHNRRARTPSKDSIASTPLYSYRGRQLQSDSRPGGRHGTAPSHKRGGSWWRLLPSYVAAAVIMFAMLYVLLLAGAPVTVRIKTEHLPEGSVTTQTDQEAYAQLARDYLRSNWLQATKVTLRSPLLEQQLAEAFPEVASASVSYGLVGRGVVINVTPEIIRVRVVTESGETHAVNDRGVSVQLLTNDTPEIIEITESVGIGTAVGEKMLPQQTLKYITEFERQLRAADLEIASIALPAVANELHAAVEGDGFIGKFDIAADVRVQAGAFIATRRQLIETNTIPSDYIDVRVAERAYYK